jgi:hypothetical protein
MPIPGRSAVVAIEPSHKQSEHSCPASSEDYKSVSVKWKIEGRVLGWLTEVRDISGHGRCCRNRPNDGGDDRERSPDDGVHSTAKGYVVGTIVIALVEEVGCETEDDGSADELSDAQDERSKT